MERLQPVAITEAVLAASNVVEPSAEWTTLTTYAEGEIVDWENHLWESLQGSNSNKEPGAAGSESWWLDRGYNNTWAMFDRAVSSASVQDEEIVVELQMPADELVDAIAVLGVNASSLQVVQTDADEGEVFNETVSLLDESGIIDAWTYCFSGFERRTDVVLDGLKPYAGSTLSITLSEPDGEAACGVCAVGQLVDFGGTQWRPKLGILDFSVKGPNEYGQTDVVERDWARTGEFVCWFPTSATDSILRRLASYRATPGVWIGNRRFGSTLIYGFFDDASVELTEASKSLLSISIRGVI